VAAAGAAAVTTGSVTSVFDAAFARGALAGVVAVAGGATVSVFAAALVTFESFAILFELTEVEEAGISNAVGMLIHILTCLNHKLSHEKNFLFNYNETSKLDFFGNMSRYNFTVILFKCA
jgi:hypothetical protein